MNPKLRLFWLGLFLLVASWQFLSPIFTPPTWIGLPIALLGALIIGLSFSDAAPGLHPGGLLCYTGAAVAVGGVAPYPYSLGGLLLFGGVVCLWFRGFGSKLHGFGFGLLLSGVIFVLQSFCHPVLMRIGSVFHNLPVFAPVICWFFSFFGYSAYCEGGTVFAQAERGIQEFAVSAEYFGWLFVFNAALGVIVWRTLGRFKHPFRYSLAFVVGALVYALGRYVVLALLFLDLHVLSIFWKPWLVCLSFLPLFLWLSCFGSKPELARDPLATVAEWPSFRLRALGAAGVAVALGLLVAAWGWEEPGQLKPGRMLIDEAHSDWELMNRKYDTEWFGEESGYNYYCLHEWLGHYYRLRKSEAKITPASLADCDILVLKTPTRAFTTEEIDAIEAFVARGGGLLLIGDHTNVFGTSTYLNPIARRFGLHYNFDATYDLPTGGLSLFKKPRLLPHPIVQWLPPFLFGTSCTLEIPWHAAVPINGYGLRVGGHDYSTPSFFTSRTDGPHIGFGLFPQLAAVKFKRGRVAAFTDSTVFSNFWMFIPGKPELLLGCTDWLNRQNRNSAASFLLCGLGLFLGVASLFCFRKQFAGSFALLFAASCLGFFAGVSSTAALNRRSYPPPTPHTPCRTIWFDNQYSHFELPSEALIHDARLEFDTFYTCVQRVGYVPRVCARLEDALESEDGLVLINPTGRMPQLEQGHLKEFVERGGVLFVLVSPTNQQTTANEVVGMFGLAISPDKLQGQPIQNGAGEMVAPNQSTGLTLGGEGILYTAGRKAVLALKREGKGTIICSASAELFSNASLGTSSTVPNLEQRRLYQITFDLLRQIEPHPAPAETASPF